MHPFNVLTRFAKFRHLLLVSSSFRPFRSPAPRSHLLSSAQYFINSEFPLRPFNACCTVPLINRTLIATLPAAYCTLLTFVSRRNLAPCNLRVYKTTVRTIKRCWLGAIRRRPFARVNYALRSNAQLSWKALANYEGIYPANEAG